MKFSQLVFATLAGVASLSLAATVPVENRAADATDSSPCPGSSYGMAFYLGVMDPTGTSWLGGLNANETRAIGP